MKIKKFIPLAIVIFVYLTIIFTARIHSGVLTFPYNPVPGDARFPLQMTANNNAVRAVVNTNIDSFNIKDLSILNIDIAAAAGIVDTKFGCAGGSRWSVITDCDLSMGNADAMHAHDASNITYGTGTVEDSLIDLASTTQAIETYVGMTGTGTVTYSLRFIGIATGTATMTVDPGTAPNGIIISMSSHIRASATPGNECGVWIPLSINGVALSSALSINYRYIVGVSISAADIGTVVSANLYYSTADGWNSSVSNSVGAGTAYNNTGDVCAGQSNDNTVVLLQAIK